MIFGKSATELKVGIFVGIGLLIMTLFVMFIGDIRNKVGSYEFTVTFSFVNGVKVGAPVRFAGVDIGEVSNLEFQSARDSAGKVLVRTLIRRDVRIPVDSQIWINTLGILGEKYIEVMPGRSEEVFKPGMIVAGNDPLAMQELGEIAKNVAKKIDDGLTDFKKLAVSLDELTRNLDDALERVKNGEGSLGKLVYRDDIYNELEAFVADVRKHPWKLFWKGKE